MTTKRGVTFSRLFPVKVVRVWFIILYLCTTILSALLITPGTLPAAQAAYSVNGTVFRDFNANGVRDPLETGVGGITVTATDSTGAVVATAITSTSPATIGQYSLNIGGAANQAVRVEFSKLPTFLKFGPNGKNNNTGVTFVNGPTQVDLGVANPSEYCQDNPELATNCYVFGDQLNGPNKNLPALIKFPFDASGMSPMPSDLAEAYQVGTTWGVTYHRYTNTVLTSAFMKRHSGFGPNGPGAIYQASKAGGSVKLLLDLNTLFGAGTAGTDPRDSTTDYRYDPNSFDAVGKIAMGGLALSDDDLTLYAVNLADRSLYRIPVGTNLTVPTASQIRRFPVPTNGPCSSPNDIRPFGVTNHDGLIYVGAVCSAQSSQNPGDLRAFVYSFDPANNSFNSNPVLSFPLNYTRRCFNFANNPNCANDPYLKADWRPWTSTFPAANLQQYGGFGGFPQPMLSDIAFDNNGDMIIGLRDRFGDQSGYYAGNTDVNDPKGLYYSGITAGHMLRACVSGATNWTLENNGTCGGRTTAGANNKRGPGGGEYYYQQNFPTGPHDYLEVGGLAVIPNQGTVVTNVFDPLNDKTRFFSGGARTFNNTTGASVRNFEIYPPDMLADPVRRTFGKANGLGDLQAICNSAPLEIGNRVWIDSNRNGLQDAGELPVAGVTVRLYDSLTKTLVAVTTTNAKGEYYFNNSNVPGGVKFNYAYYVRLDNPADFLSGGPLFRYNLTATAVGTNPAIDNNGVLLGGYPQADVLTGGAGDNNHTYDFGFFQTPTPTPTATVVVPPTNTPTPEPRRSPSPTSSISPNPSVSLTPSTSPTPPDATIPPDTTPTPTGTPSTGQPPSGGDAPPSDQPPVSPPLPQPPNTGRAQVDDGGIALWVRFGLAGLLVIGGGLLLYRGFVGNRRDS